MLSASLTLNGFNKSSKFFCKHDLIFNCFYLHKEWKHFHEKSHITAFPPKKNHIHKVIKSWKKHKPVSWLHGVNLFYSKFPFYHSISYIWYVAWTSSNTFCQNIPQQAHLVPSSWVITFCVSQHFGQNYPDLNFSQNDTSLYFGKVHSNFILKDKAPSLFLC